METEKEKNLTEKSSSFASRDDSETKNHQHPHPHPHPHPHDDNQDDQDKKNSQNHNFDRVPQPSDHDHKVAPPSDDDDDPPLELEAAANKPHETETEHKQGDHEEPAAAETSIIIIKEEDKDDDSSSPPPPDLCTVSEEIDRFISALLSAKVDQSSDPPDVPDFVEQFSVLIEAKITNYDSSESPVKWSLISDNDSSSFLEAVDRISKLMTSLCQLSSESKYASSINRVGGIQQRAMSYLEEEFRSLLEDSYKNSSSSYSDHHHHHHHHHHHNNNNNVDSTKQSPSSSSSNQEIFDHSSSLSESDSTSTGRSENNIFPGYSDEAMSTMKTIAKAMMSGGYESECCQVYAVARRNAMEEWLHKLGFEKYSIDDVQKMQWEPLEREIVSWIKIFKQCTTVYLPGERKLSEAVFSDSYYYASSSLFSALSRVVMIQLLNFSEAVAMTKRSSEKLFKFLDIYEALRDLISTMDGGFSLFPEECVHELKSEASLIRCRLGDSMVCIFGVLENSIKADTGKTQVPGGAVHPLTRYTMNYLKYACEYKDTLEQVFREHQKIDRADSATGSDYDCNAHAHAQVQAQAQAQNYNNNNNEVVKQSPLGLQITKVMDLLDTNLEAKSKIYRDTSLSLIFMMNNGRYILQKIRGATEINALMGDTWSRKRSSDLRQYHKNYQRETWGKLLHCLTHEGLNVNGKVVKPVLKERFKSFNAIFDEIHKAQSAWVVSDEQLQSELRVSISAVVIPAYRSFLARFSQVFTPGRQTEKYIKYQAEDIETYIDELFDGNVSTMARRKQ